MTVSNIEYTCTISVRNEKVTQLKWYLSFLFGICDVLSFNYLNIKKFVKYILMNVISMKQLRATDPYCTSIYFGISLYDSHNDYSVRY